MPPKKEFTVDVTLTIRGKATVMAHTREEAAKEVEDDIHMHTEEVEGNGELVDWSVK